MEDEVCSVKMINIWKNTDQTAFMKTGCHNHCHPFNNVVLNNLQDWQCAAH